MPLVLAGTGKGTLPQQRDLPAQHTAFLGDAPTAVGQGGAGSTHMRLPFLTLEEETSRGLNLSDNTTNAKYGDAEAGV